MSTARITLADEANFRIGPLGVRPSERALVIGGVGQVIEPRMMQVLIALAREPGVVVSRQRLMDQCWGSVSVGDDALNRVVAKLRQTAEATGAFTLETIPKVGYRLTPTRVAPDGPEAGRGKFVTRLRISGAIAAGAAMAIGWGLWMMRPPSYAAPPAYAGPRLFTDCPTLCPQMVVLPRGRFRMGSATVDGGDHAGPREVHIAYDLAVSRYDVTREQYAAFVAATGRARTGGCAQFNKRGLLEEGNGSWDQPGFPQTSRDPVVCVNWADATAYGRWLAQQTGKPYRLLSDAEWEYAARAGTMGRVYWAPGISPCARLNAADADYAHVYKWDAAVDRSCHDGFVHTSPVGAFPPNGFGLYDMLGDAAQSTADCADPGPTRVPVDGAAWTSPECTARDVRGSAWNETPATADVARRLLSDMQARFPTNGFRVARVLD